MNFLRFIQILLFICDATSAFVVHPTIIHYNNGRIRNVKELFMVQIDLKPEPVDGLEMKSKLSMPGCRMKELEPLLDMKNDLAYKYWLTAEAEGRLIKEIRTQILKDASKKANFPGFRKGQVPPYAQPQITQFSVQEAIMKTVQAAVDAFGLQTLPSSDGEVEVFEDVASIAKAYKIGDSITFTARVNAAYKSNLDRERSIAIKQQPIEAEIIEAVVEDLIEAEAVEKDTETEVVDKLTETDVVKKPEETEVVELEAS